MVAFESISALSTETGGSSLTVTPPAGIANGDILVAIITYNSTLKGDCAPPSGWTSFIFNNSQIANPNMHFFWKRAASESGNYVFTFGGGNFGTFGPSGGRIMRYSGAAASGNPIDAVEPYARYEASEPVHPVLPSLNVRTANSALVIAGASQSSGVQGTFSPPAGFTEQADDFVQSSYEMFIATKDALVGAGETGAFTVTKAGFTGDVRDAFAVFAISPAEITFEPEVQYRGYPHDGNQCVSFANTQTLIARPHGLTVGDLMIASLATDTQTVTPPAGWAVLANNSFAFVAWKIADASDVATAYFTFLFSGLSSQNGTILAFHGHDQGEAPIFSLVSGTTAPSVTIPSNRRALLLRGGQGRAPFNIGNCTFSNYGEVADYVERFDTPTFQIVGGVKQKTRMVGEGFTGAVGLNGGSGFTDFAWTLGILAALVPGHGGNAGGVPPAPSGVPTRERIQRALFRRDFWEEMRR